MALCLTAPPSSAMLNPSSSLNLQNLRKTHLQRVPSPLSALNRSDFGVGNRAGSTAQVRATCFFTPADQPILKEALKEPVAFMGGMFAGLLRLDLEEEPLKEWVTRTVEASGVTIENTDNGEGLNPEEVPQQIEIE